MGLLECDELSNICYCLRELSSAHHGRTGDSNFDDLALGRVDEGLEVLEVLDFDRLVMSIK